MSDFFDAFFAFWGLCELEPDLKLCVVLSKALFAECLGGFLARRPVLDTSSLVC
jgi:hypothetical protein